MKYMILAHRSLTALQIDVNEALADGWRPVGGVSVFNGLWTQAVTIEGEGDALAAIEAFEAEAE